jgi:hypothetical protein
MPSVDLGQWCFLISCAKMWLERLSGYVCCPVLMQRSKRVRRGSGLGYRYAIINKSIDYKRLIRNRPSIRIQVNYVRHKKV